MLPSFASLVLRDCGDTYSEINNSAWYTAKGADPTRDELISKYEADYADAADRVIRQMIRFAPK